MQSQYHADDISETRIVNYSNCTVVHKFSTAVWDILVNNVFYISIRAIPKELAGFLYNYAENCIELHKQELILIDKFVCEWSYVIGSDITIH